jgi:hypothetical protein
MPAIEENVNGCSTREQIILTALRRYEEYVSDQGLANRINDICEGIESGNILID